MLITPRDYQAAATQKTIEYFVEKEKPGNPLVLSPTGTGKSIMIGDLCEKVIKNYPHHNIQVLTHVKELIDQNYNKMLQMWPGAPAGIYSAGLGRRDRYVPILFAGIQSIYGRSNEFAIPNIVVVDEAHLVGPSDKTMYNKLFSYYREQNPKIKFIGYSATGFRLGQGMLIEGDDSLFTDIVFDLTTLEGFNWLIEQGYILSLIPKRTVLKLDVDGVTRVGGDFNQLQLQAKVDRDEITERALRETRELAHDRKKWLIFATGIHHCESITRILAMMGIDCVPVHSKLHPKICDKNIADFRAGKVRAAVNFGKLTTGFDDEYIDCIVMLRPTQSPGLWVQMLGRGTRPIWDYSFDLDTLEGRHACIANSPKQNCLVLDFARNTRRLGPINDPKIPGRKGKGGGEAPVKICPACDTYNHPSVRRCIYCGHEFVIAVKFEAEASTDEILRPNAFPQVEICKIDNVTYQLHHKRNAPDMIRVSYWTNQYAYSEFLCFEHDGTARKRAVKWWEERCFGKVPFTTQQALDTIEMAKAPTHIRVVVNKKYPEVLAYCFDGTAFGTKTNMFDTAPPTTKVLKSPLLPHLLQLQKSVLKHVGAEDEEIPF